MSQLGGLLLNNDLPPLSEGHREWYLIVTQGHIDRPPNVDGALADSNAEALNDTHRKTNIARLVTCFPKLYCQLLGFAVVIASSHVFGSANTDSRSETISRSSPLGSGGPRHLLLTFSEMSSETSGR